MGTATAATADTTAAPPARPAAGRTGGDQHEGYGLPGGEWITLAQAADRFGIDRGAINAAVLRRSLPARKLQRHRTAPYLVRPADVEEYLARTTKYGYRIGRPPIGTGRPRRAA